jgi:hypothetical protein
MLAQYQDKPVNWSGGSIVSVSGQSFTQALQAYLQYTPSSQSFLALAGVTLTISGWINTAGLAGHPSTSSTWNAALAVLFTSTSGVQSYATVTGTTVASGSGWTYVTGTVTIPANAATLQLCLNIDQTTNNASYTALFANVTCTLSFNGWNILPMPKSPAPKQLDMEITDSVSQVQSPFTLATQMQVWPGAERWNCNVSMPPMKRPISNPWVAWLMSLQGILNTFLMGDATHAIPAGNPAGTPLVDGTVSGYNLPAFYVLHTKGWTPNTGNLLLAGDYIQLGVRLHRLTKTVNSDANGNAVLNIWPAIREMPGDGQLLIVSDTRGLWRLAENKRAWTEFNTQIVPLSWKMTEAR